MIKYLGSKRKLIPDIMRIVEAVPDIRSACDLFTGTTRVAQALKRHGLHVVANDTATYAWQLARTFVEIDPSNLDVPYLETAIDSLNALPGVDGYFTQTFAREARFFHPDNAQRIDAIRPEIERIARDDDERSVLLVSLMLAADRVDSTTGLQMAFLKEWAPRALKPMKMALPAMIQGSGEATQEDALGFLAHGRTREVDLTYVDPPYNQHSYFGNYHIWETLMRNDAPEAYGIARKRIDTRDNRSVFNSSPKFGPAFAELIAGIESPWVLVSFNDEGYIRRDDVEALLGRGRDVVRIDVAFQRYIGARIGIHNPAGQRVGEVSHTRNTEHLFLAGPPADMSGVRQVLALD